MFYLVIAGALFYDAGPLAWREGSLPVIPQYQKGECWLIGPDLAPHL